MMSKKIGLLFSLSLFITILLTSSCQNHAVSSFRNPRIEIASYRAVSVQKGDTIYIIAKRYDIALRDLIEANNLRPPYVIKQGQGLRLPIKHIHIVRKFETVRSIARDRHVSQHDLIENNKLSAPYTLYENQRLKLPYKKKQKPYWGKTTTLKKAPRKTIIPLVSKTSEKNWENNFIAPGEKRITTLEPVSPIKPHNDKFLNKDKKKAAAPPLEKRAFSASSQRRAFLVPLKPSFKQNKRGLKKQPQTKKNINPSFSWPVRGRILSKYGHKKGGLKNDGINIQAIRGTAVKASEFGQVVYVGGALKGYGKLILLKHNGGWLTTYAHLKNTRIKKGQRVQKGQIMGTVGTTGNVKMPQLHFEIRKRTQTLDPLRFLK